MLPVIQLRRVLEAAQTPKTLPDVEVRSYGKAGDIERWLTLREQAFAGLEPAVRTWDAADFEREFLAQPWWQPEHMWLAESAGQMIGSVTLAVRKSSGGVRPAVHWLAVAPAWQRRGVASLLLDTLHAACWQLGHREVFAETHTGWTAAVRCYERLGYRRVT